MATVQITCDTPDTEIRYTLNGSDPNESSTLYSNTIDINEVTTVKARAYKDGWTDSSITSKLVDGPFNELISVSVGSTYTIDGIEVFCIKEGQAYTSDRGTTLIDDGTTPEVSEHPIFVDKNHDLVYYFAGSDYQNESESVSVINSTNKYGYEWGGYGVDTGITDRAVGSGLTNTNSLIGMNLQPFTDGWYVVWDKVKEFRETYGNKWFVPSSYELYSIYTNRNSLSGLTITNDSDLNPYYWSSSEYTPYEVYSQRFGNVNVLEINKDRRRYRTRLCRQI